MKNSEARAIALGLLFATLSACTQERAETDLLSSPSGSSPTNGSPEYATPKNQQFADFRPGQVTTLVTGLTGADGLVLRDDGSLLVSSPDYGTVTEVQLDGRSAPFANGLVEPFGMSGDSDGRTLVADWGARRVKRISTTGNIAVFSEVAGRPGRVFVDREDNVFLPYSYSGRLDVVFAHSPLA